MDKKLLILILIMVSCNVNKRKEVQVSDYNYSISAKINGIKDSAKVFIYHAENRAAPLDSSLVINKQFKFKGSIDEPQPVFFFFSDNSSIIFPKYHFWLDKSNIIINASIKGENLGDFEYFTKKQINGSKLNHILIDYHNKTKDVYKEKGKRVFENEIKEFVFEQPNNFLSLSLFYRNSKGIFKDSLKTYLNSLDSLHRNSSYGKAIKKQIETKEIKKGDYFVDIVAKDLDENIVRLSDFKNKVILLDFWSSTCAPCREQIRNKFSTLIGRYRNDDFIIVNFSLDTNYKAWKRASEEDGINWVNISDLQGTRSEAVINYNVWSIPRTFLIDKKGIIRSINVGYTEENSTIEKEIDNIIE